MRFKLLLGKALLVGPYLGDSKNEERQEHDHNLTFPTLFRLIPTLLLTHSVTLNFHRFA